MMTNKKTVTLEYPFRYLPSGETATAITVRKPGATRARLRNLLRGAIGLSARNLTSGQEREQGNPFIRKFDDDFAADQMLWFLETGLNSTDFVRHMRSIRDMMVNARSVAHITNTSIPLSEETWCEIESTNGLMAVTRIITHLHCTLIDMDEAFEWAERN